MPIIEVNMFEGRTSQQKREMISAVTQAVAQTLDVPETNVRIIIRELSKDNFGIGGKTAFELGR
ncbi:2-hydroxymuconate tautomerase [Pollutimonas thiosulfatoxidans]|uniref:Tautomerase n=1 Tax=Pollutimonas thiosulfatoxidans TaxID=2028345 RepID=A0A410G8P5_9BURK|nr:2-hydroxymuconate tautomerase [Pollutimonas thiosulfatoxidans]QAA92646.1 hypothetical protein CKA81_01390 [Pollutimonas thiosulfatoxidans]